MKIINLRDFYPFYTQDTFIELPDELVAIFDAYNKAESAYNRQKYRYNAHYSLDCGDGIENDILFVSLTADEIYERNLTSQQLHAAIASLPDKQSKRIYAHYFMGMSKTFIAKAEGVNEKAIRISIERGLHSIEKYLKKYL